MTKILLFCSAGMSTSMLVTKMKKAAKAKNIEDVEIDALPQAQMINHAGDADVVLLGPQIKFMLPKAKGIFDPKGIPVSVIDSADYGMLNGEKVLEAALKMAKR